MNIIQHIDIDSTLYDIEIYIFFKDTMSNFTQTLKMKINRHTSQTVSMKIFTLRFTNVEVNTWFVLDYIIIFHTFLLLCPLPVL